MGERIPNLLWVVTTQWRAQAFARCGDANARTPFLDAFAQDCIRFNQAVTPHPFGPFARAAMLTGVPSPANGIEDYYDPLPAGTSTIAHELKDRGYHTAFFGKWHLAQRDRHAPLVGDVHARMTVAEADRGGFAFWEGFESGFLLNDPWLHGTRLPQPIQFPGYQSDVVCERAGKYLDSLPGPWFAVVSLEAPHPPYRAPAAGIVPMAPESLVFRENVPQDPEVIDRLRKELPGYYAQIEATDRSIGRFLGTIPKDTVVVFTSAHGDMHGSHGIFRKGWPHEESVRVPFCLRLPDREQAGDSDLPISLIDLSALTQRIADGNRTLPSIDAARISMPSIVDLSFQCDRSWRGVRTPAEKLVVEANGEPWMYHDLKADPFELHNLAWDPGSAARIARLRELL